MESLPIPLGVVLVAIVIATITDLRMFKIHNLLTLPLIASGLVYHGVTGGSHGLAGSGLGALCGFGLLFAFFLIGGMGGGDVKLMAGVGAWLGAPLTFAVFVVASLAAGVYSAAVILTGGRLRETWVNLQILFHRTAAVSRHLAAEDRVEEAVLRSDRRRRLVPFGAMMCVGLVSLMVLARLRPWE